jgi:hypothetical protein
VLPDKQAFSGVLYSGYGAPSNLCFDYKCNAIPIQDDRTLYDYNVDWVINNFVNVTLNDQVRDCSVDQCRRHASGGLSSLPTNAGQPLFRQPHYAHVGQRLSV